MTPQTVGRQASLPMEFSRQEYWSGLPFPEYWSGLPFPLPEELPNPGIEPWSPASQTDSLPFELQGSLSPRLRTGERSPLCHGPAAGWSTWARSESTSKPLKAELRWNTSPGKPSAHEALDGLTLKKQNPQLKTLEESDGILLYVCGGVCKI